jgi:hypothetical protein
MIKPLSTELYQPLCNELPGSAPDQEPARQPWQLGRLTLPLTAANANADEAERDAGPEPDRITG